MPNTKVICYKNKYWRLSKSFSYTGADQPFTLQSGKYLFVCKGGKTICRNNDIESVNYGGTSYGILDLSERTTFHAVVGGDVDNTIVGGFNGGANGTFGMSSTYSSGIGGAGASDVRLVAYNPNEYPTYDSNNNLIDPAMGKTYYYDSSYDASASNADEHRYMAVEYIRSYYTSGYIDTGFQDTNNSRILIDVNIEYTNNPTYGTLIGCAYANIAAGGMGFYSKYENTGVSKFYRGNGSTSLGIEEINIPFGERITIDIKHHNLSISMGSTVLNSYDIGNSDTVWAPSTVGVSINCIIRGSGYSRLNDRPIPMMLYGFKGYNNNTLESDLVPVKRMSDGWCGLFNKIDNTFHPVSDNTNSSYWIPGPPKLLTPSLNSRIIVAGGAGGTYALAASSNNYSSMTAYGGLTGGYVNTNTPNTSYNLNANMFASQTKGHTFGYGGKPVDRPSSNTYSSEGSGGGGGGWYGGFSAYYKSQMSYQSTNGGGGSSYVLTRSSYKPPEYTPSSKYYMTDPCMTVSDASEAGICVYEETSLKPGDIIEFPCIGEGEHVQLPAGRYKFQCYGGNGGSRRRWMDVSKGGYSEGIFTTLYDRDIHVYVGGSGGPAHVIWKHLGTVDEQHTNSTFFTSAFNGGHKITLDHGSYGTNSGGGTDIRIDDDNLYNRIIVAGGGGAQGGFMINTLGSNCVGGIGGGEIGGSPAGGSGNNYGGGTQTNSPGVDNKAALRGSFGVGGGIIYSTSYNALPGSGGGGWFGGSGTEYGRTDDANKGGAGGSGFVLTSGTTLIDGYKLTHDDALTNAYTIAGGNNLGPNMSKAVITVEAIYAKMICEDNDGYKYYDRDIDKWVLLPDQHLTPEIFEQYGGSIKTDNGLNGRRFKVHVYDESESCKGILLTVVPPKQFIYVNTELELDITGLSLDDKKHSSDEYDVSCTAIRKPDPETSRMITYIQLLVDKLTDSGNYYRAYGARILYNGAQDEHEYLKLARNGRRLFKHYITNDESGELVIEERTMELEDPEKYRDPITREITVHQSLLRVGVGNRIPIKYLNIIDQDASTIYAILFAECDRVVYMLSIVKINNVFMMLIKSINIQTGTVVDLVRRNWSEVYTASNYNSAVNGFLVDDNYYYIGANAYSNATYNSRLIKVNRTTGEVSLTSATPVAFAATWGSRISWLADDKILAFSASGVLIYDINDNTWKSVAHDFGNVNFYQVAIGDKYIVFTYNGNVYVIDINTYKSVTRFSASGSDTYTWPSITYNDGKFYIVNYRSFIDVLDEKTLTLSRLASISPMTNANEVQYVNGALYITQEGSDSSNKQIVYRLNEKTHSIIYTPWSALGQKDFDNSWFGSFETHGIFFTAVNTMLLSDYTGYAKYKFGKRFARNDISFAIDNIDNMQYDERFVTVDEAGVTVHDGDIEYELSDYNSNHIATCEIVKNDYNKIITSSSINED